METRKQLRQRYLDRKKIDRNNFAIRTGDYVFVRINRGEVLGIVSECHFSDGDRYATIDVGEDHLPILMKIDALRRISNEEAMLWKLENH